MRMLGVGVLGLSVAAGAQTYASDPNKDPLPPVRVGAAVALGFGTGVAAEVDIYGEATHFWLRPGLEIRGYAADANIKGTLVGPRVEHCLFGACFYGATMFGPNHTGDPGDVQGIASQLSLGAELLPPEHPNFGWKVEFNQTFYSGALPRSSSSEVVIGFVVKFP